MKLRPGIDYLDENEARRIVRFFEEVLVHVKGFSGNIKLEPWQKKILTDIFATKVKSTELLRYRRSIIFIPRKNGKSTIGAGAALAAEVLHNEIGAEIYSAAADREQARLCFSMAQEMVKQSPRLSKVLEVYRDSIIKIGTNTFYKVISADADKKHGFNSYFILFDELHAQAKRDLWDVLTTSTGSRLWSHIMAISTAGYDRNTIGYEQYDYACKVRDGLIDDPETYVYIAEASPDDDPFDPATWAKANPNMGVSISESYLRSEAARAKATPSYLNTFKRLHLNIWTSSEQAWIPPDVWNKGNKGIIDLSLLKNEDAYIGIDMASKGDLAEVVIIFPKHYIVKAFHWVPSEKITDRKNKLEIDYSPWVDAGWITKVDGNAHDYESIEKKIIELCMTHNVKKVGFDPWGMNELAQRLMASGSPMKPRDQTHRKLNEGTLKIEELAMQGLLQHGGDPVLAWMVNNVMITEDSDGRKKPDKRKAKDKIDGAMAMVIAASEWCGDTIEVNIEPGIMVI